MFLNDIGKSPDATFKKINKHLESNYGFKITEDISEDRLSFIVDQIEEEIEDLKLQGNDAKSSPEISKRLLILEGIKSLQERMLLQSPELSKVICGMADFVYDNFCLSGTCHDDFEESLRDAMKHYRSSKYRFPDDVIEQRVRERALSRIHGMGHDQHDGSFGSFKPQSGSDLGDIGHDEIIDIDDIRPRHIG